MQRDEDGFVTAVAPPASAGVDALANDLGAALNTKEKEETKDEGSSADPMGLLRSTFDVEVTLADQQADPNSPLYSVKTFEELGLSAELMKGIRAMGFVRPSKIQERALPMMINNPPTNMIAQSQSGTGKTAAFVLTMLTRIDYSKQETQALCLCPARELARQIMDVVTTMARFTNCTTGYAIKDGPATPNAQLVVGTPGTMFDQINKGILKTGSVRVFVLDEADNMLEKGSMGEQTMRVKNRVPKTAQTLLFSATFSPQVRVFAQRFAPRANEIMLRTEELSVEGIKQFYLDCATEARKYDVLVELYNLMTVGQSIIFVQKRVTADEIARRMTENGHKVTSLHGSKDALERDSTIDDFRNGKSKVLITTNVVARGIDIAQVNLVINYDIPLTANHEPDVETYLHRIGRTGRFGRKGVSINFVHDRLSWERMHAIEEALQKKIERISPEDADEMEKILRSALKETGPTLGSGGKSMHES